MNAIVTYRRPGLLGNSVVNSFFESFFEDFPSHLKQTTQGYPVADIYSNENTRYISWNQDELKHFQVSNKELWIKLHNILSKDLIQKIKTTNQNE